MNKINSLNYKYEAWDKRYDLEKWFHDDYVLWMRALFYGDLMDYLKYKNPGELTLVEFRAKCEQIYEDHKSVYELLEISYKDLYDDKQLYEILEAWDDLHSNDGENE